MRRLSAIAFLIALAACGQADNDPGPGGVTVGEARALDEAAAMLEEQRLPAANTEPSFNDDDGAEGADAPRTE